MMKKIKIILFVIFVSVVLSGCSKGESNDKLTKEEVLEKSRINFENLESLEQKSKILLVFDLKDDKTEQTINMDVTMKYDKDKNIDNIYTRNETKQDGNSRILGFYKGSDGTFINDGTGWTEYNSPEDYSTTYKPTLDSFLNTANSMNMTETESTYEFKYTGKDGNVFRTAAKPYNINYRGIGDDNIQIDLKYIVNKKNMFLLEADVKTKAVSDPENKISINGRSVFSDFNSIKEIDKPDKL